MRALLLTALLFVPGLSMADEPPPKTPPIEKLTLGGKPFRLELADDDAARRKGLSGRKRIATDGGMLFVFRKAAHIHTVMAYCRVPIDAVFVASDGRILSVHAMPVEPPRKPTETDKAYRKRLRKYRSQGAAQFVIELAGGRAKALGLKAGQRVALDRDRLVKQAR